MGFLNELSGQPNALEPEVEELADGTLQIDKFVTGVSLADYKWFTSSSNKQMALFTFANADGDTIPKFIMDPAEKPHIQKLEGTEKKKMAGYTYFEVLQLFKTFIKEEVVAATAAMIPDPGENIDGFLELMCDTLFKLTENEDNLLSTEETILKVAFKEAEGQAPSFSIPQNRYIGRTDFKKKDQPSWFVNAKDPKWSDIRNFRIVEKTPTFGSGIGGVTQGIAIPATPGLAATPSIITPEIKAEGQAIQEVFQSDALNTPNVDLG